MSSTTMRLPGVRHKVIGLVSGGKDSCFNLMHSIANGHEIVALANLKPEAGVDELDSHLYQSVGTQILPLIAQAMNLPLYTRVIKGKAVERGPEYGLRERGGDDSGSKGDETEDLTELLKEVLASHPDATALASGAILSNYQRLRIEHVCGRLKLVSMSYLWQQPQLPLLDSMLHSGVQAILVKVAGVGLGINIVGKELGAVYPLLKRLEKEYGSHPAGEGGEYETLTLDTPLFSHRIKLVKTSVVVTDPEPYPVAYLRIEQAELEEKLDWSKPTVSELRQTLGLDDEADSFDETSRGIYDGLTDGFSGSSSSATPRGPSDELSALSLRNDSDVQDTRFASTGRWFSASVDGQSLDGETIGDELRRCFEALKDSLRAKGLELSLHATHITLLLSSMDLFIPANAVYTTYFGTSPPSRATVAVPLLSGERVRLEVVGFDDRNSDEQGRLVGGRQALHVQGLSYWAPANIGPYSQAVLTNSRLHMAGQIPLIPAFLTLPLAPPAPTSPYPHQAVLALQHVSRIVEVMSSKNSTGGGWTGWGESCVAWWAHGDYPGANGGQVARAAWRAWAVEAGSSSSSCRSDAWTKTPVMFVKARELPKGALVEYQVNLHTGRRDLTTTNEKVGESGNAETEDDEDDDEDLEPVFSSGEQSGLRWETCVTSGKYQRGSRGMCFATDVASLRRESVGSDLQLVIDRAVGVRIYHRVDVTVDKRTLELLKSHGQTPCVTLIPVFEIHDRSGNEAAVALDIFGI